MWDQAVEAVKDEVANDGLYDALEGYAESPEELRDLRHLQWDDFEWIIDGLETPY